MAHAITVVAFDKTGTLTEGKPKLVAAVPAAGDRHALLAAAAAIQAGSEHPLARAVLDAVSSEGATANLPDIAATQVRAVSGKSMSALVAGRELRLGSTRYMNELDVDFAVLAGPAQQHEAEGQKVSWLADVTDKPVLSACSPSATP